MNGRATLMSQLAAVARRDWATWRSYHFQLAFRLIAVAASLTTFFFISKLVGSASEVAEFGGYFEFAVIGLIVMNGTAVALHALGEAMDAERSAGTLEILLASPIKLSRLLLGGMIVPLAIFLVEVSVILAVSTAFGLEFSLIGLLASVPVLLLTMATFMGMSTMSTAFTVLTKRGDPFGLLVTQASNLVAGSLFPVALLPLWLEVVARFVPAFYGLNAIRALMFKSAGYADVAGEIAILIGFALLLYPIGLSLLRKALAAARVTGTIGNY